MVLQEVREVLVFGRTGAGKSAMIEEADREGIHYKVIDTVGLGDTRMTSQEVLQKLAEACITTKGFHQLLFVTSGRITQEEIESFELLQTVFFGKEVLKFITLVRTRFPGFRNTEKCEGDTNKLKEESHQLHTMLSSCRKVIHVNNMNKDEDPRQHSRKAIKTLFKQRNFELFTDVHKDITGLPRRISERKTIEQQIYEEIERQQREMDEMEPQIQRERETRGIMNYKRVTQIIKRKFFSNGNEAIHLLHV